MSSVSSIAIFVLSVGEETILRHRFVFQNCELIVYAPFNCRWWKGALINRFAISMNSPQGMKVGLGSASCLLMEGALHELFRFRACRTTAAPSFCLTVVSGSDSKWITNTCPAFSTSILFDVLDLGCGLLSMLTDYCFVSFTNLVCAVAVRKSESLAMAV